MFFFLLPIFGCLNCGWYLLFILVRIITSHAYLIVRQNIYWKISHYYVAHILFFRKMYESVFFFLYLFLIEYSMQSYLNYIILLILAGTWWWSYWTHDQRIGGGKGGISGPWGWVCNSRCCSWVWWTRNYFEHDPGVYLCLNHLDI